MSGGDFGLWLNYFNTVLLRSCPVCKSKNFIIDLNAELISCNNYCMSITDGGIDIEYEQNLYFINLHSVLNVCNDFEVECNVLNIISSNHNAIIDLIKRIEDNSIFI